MATTDADILAQFPSMDYAIAHTKAAMARNEKFWAKEWSDPNTLRQIKSLACAIADMELTQEQFARILDWCNDAPPGLMGWGKWHRLWFIVDVCATQQGHTRLPRAIAAELRLQYNAPTEAQWIVDRCAEWDELLK